MSDALPPSAYELNQPPGTSRSPHTLGEEPPLTPPPTELFKAAVAVERWSNTVEGVGQPLEAHTPRPAQRCVR